VVDLDQRTTARTLLFGHQRDDELASVMRANLPQVSTAEALLRERPMPPAAYRLLDSRIVDTALGFLDEDVSAVLLDGLSTCRAVVQAAQDTRADPAHGEQLVPLVDPYRITSTHEPYIALEYDGREIARIPFEVTVEFGMGQTAVVIRRGAIEAVETEPCSLAVTITMRGWPTPLLHRELPVRVRLQVRPPIPVPLSPRAGHRVHGVRD
jgi:hypothetical protein